MDILVVTGSSGLIGSESVLTLKDKFDLIIGIDNNQRQIFFGSSGSTLWRKEQLEKDIDNYIHYDMDIRDEIGLGKIFKKYGQDIKLIIHAAAQPSHDWAANNPKMDFTINSLGTLNLLECTREFCPNSVFIFTSTNKVYGDRPNTLPIVEKSTRWEISSEHEYYNKGINEEMSIDSSTHSLFGVSKLSADVMCQEYGRYFNLKIGIFRGGCLTGSGHSGVELHGFLSYLVKCSKLKKHYTIFGYKGKQVRDNIHSKDLISAFFEFYKNPRHGEVYNIGGGLKSNCSVIEAINLIEDISGQKFKYTISENNRIGDHIWYVSDLTKFKTHFPKWNQEYSLRMIIEEMFNES